MSGDGTTGKGGAPESLVGALDTVAQLLLGERFASLQRAAEGLEADLSGRIEAMERGARTEIERLRSGLSARLDELRTELASAEERQRSVVGEVGDRARRATAQVEEVRRHVDERVDEVKHLLEQTVAARTEKLRHELDGLTGQLAGIRVELERQLVKSERISTLLDGLATFFAGRPEAGEAAQAVSAPPGAAPPGASAAKDEAASPENDPDPTPTGTRSLRESDPLADLDGALDRMFRRDP